MPSAEGHHITPAGSGLRFEEARGIYDKALALSGDPWPRDAVLLLGSLCLEAGDAARARELYAAWQEPNAECRGDVARASCRLELAHETDPVGVMVSLRWGSQ